MWSSAARWQSVECHHAAILTVPIFSAIVASLSAIIICWCDGSLNSPMWWRLFICSSAKCAKDSPFKMASERPHCKSAYDTIVNNHIRDNISSSSVPPCECGANSVRVSVLLQITPTTIYTTNMPHRCAFNAQKSGRLSVRRISKNWDKHEYKLFSLLMSAVCNHVSTELLN